MSNDFITQRKAPMMMSATSDRREPWIIDESEFYEQGSRRGEMEFLLRYAVLAPSGHNTQPWRFAIVEDGIEIYADYTRRLAHVDPDHRELLMSVGAAIMNLRVAAAHFGFEATVIYELDSRQTRPVALVTLRESCDTDASLRRLFPAIVRRRTNRHEFDGEPLPLEALSSLCDVADEHPDYIQFLFPRDKATIARLVAEGDRMLMENRAVREELADWVRPARTSANDGICADAFGIPDILSPAAASLIRRADLGGMQARRDSLLVESSPLLAVITSEDDQVSLLKAGQVLERLLLTATLDHLQYSFMNQPVQVAALRGALASLVYAAGPPQVMIRFGNGQPIAEPMPRRNVQDVMESD